MVLIVVPPRARELTVSALWLVLELRVPMKTEYPASRARGYRWAGESLRRASVF